MSATSPGVFRASDGFTLLETLVGLAISAMIATLLTYVLRFALLEGSRSSAAITRTMDKTLDVERVAALFNNVLAAYPTDRASVIGDESNVEIYASQPSGGARKPPARHKLALIADGARGAIKLVMDAGENNEVMLVLPADSAAFAYLGRDLDWHDRWPLEDALQKTGLSPPLAIRIRSDIADSEEDVFFAVGGQGTPPLRVQDMLSFGGE